MTKNKNIPSIFRLAKNVSKNSDHRYKMGSVIVKNGKPLSVGFNQIKSNPNAPYLGLHCEQHALQNCGKENLKGCSIFVYRENRVGDPAMAKPCKNCQKILKENGFRWMYYSVDEYPFWECEKL